MEGIRKRGDKYQVRWRRLDGRDDSCTVATVTEAEAVRRAVKRAHRDGREWEPQTESPRARLSDVAGAYQDARRLRVRAHTLRVETGHLDVFLRFCGERQITHLDELRRAVLDEFLAWLMRPETARHKQQRKPGSAARIVEAARLLWQWAADSERWPDVPRVPSARALELPRSRPPPVVAPTWAEMDAMIEAARGWQRKLAVWLRWTGLRAGESMALAWSDVDLARGTLTIRPEIDKNDEGRIIPLAPAILDEIATWGRREGYLLPCGRLKSRDARGRDAERTWKRAGVREAAWKGHPWHAFRRGFKSGLLALGCHPDAVDFLQGHALGSGSRGRYIDGSHLPLRETLALIPAVGAASENVMALVAVGQALDKTPR